MVKIKNTITGKLEELLSDKINWYICGPTVYDQPHIGHARTYLDMDLKRRVLQDIMKIPIKLVMNITDIDDKIINASKINNSDPLVWAKKQEKIFWQEMSELNITLPDIITRVSQFIPQIINLIETLIEKKYAYPSHNSIYFDSQKYLADGFSLQLLPQASKKEGKSVKETTLMIKGEKKHSADFALWKAIKPDETLGWKSPFTSTLGRPGWHTECVAMIIDSFSESEGKIDIHSGGLDLRFPHHENELAQACAYLGSKDWVKVFNHTAQLNDEDGKKMSKSLGNYISLREALDKHSPNLIRMIFFIHHYSNPINYSDGLFIEAEAKWKYLTKFLDNLQGELKHLSPSPWDKEDQQLWNHFLDLQNGIYSFLIQDFETQYVWELTSELINTVYKYQKNKEVNQHSYGVLSQIYQWIKNLYSQLGFQLNTLTSTQDTDSSKYIDIIVEMRADIRAHLIKEKNFEPMKILDKWRDEKLPSIGIEVKDISKEKSIWSYKE